jgi:hypothetical protein
VYPVKVRIVFVASTVWPKGHSLRALSSVALVSFLFEELQTRSVVHYFKLVEETHRQQNVPKKPQW